MANDWGSVPLIELTATPPTYGVVQPGQNLQDGVPMVRVNNFQGHSLNLTEVMRIAPEVESKYMRTRIQEGDVLITIVGSVGQVAIVPSDLNDWNIARAVAMIRPKEPELSRWIALVLRSPDAQYQLGVAANTTVQTTINLKDLRQLRIPFPDESERRAIAHILGTLDDKIELNRKENETLESMARTLFKAWFVDFEPVRAKMEGRWQRGQSLPGLPAHVYDLFPDCLAESEFGEIPEGWEVTSLSEFSSLNPESWTKRTRPGEIRYVDLSNTKWGRIESVTNYEADDAPSRAQRVLRPLDTIFGTVRPGNGSYALISDEGLTGSTGFAVLRPLRRECSEFVYLAATARENIERLSNLADGGAYPAVRPEIVSATQVPSAGQELINEFSRQVSPMLAGIADNERTSSPLAQLRDTLLPKLVSGELRVPDAERIVGVAV